MAVSSALLFLLAVPTPYHDTDMLKVAGAAGTGANPTVVISEFYPRALCADEYVVVTSVSETTVCLDNWSLTDMEGTLRFVGDRFLEPSCSLVISMNSSSYILAFDQKPDVSLDAVGDCGMTRSGSFRLADTGDSMALASNTGDVVDFVVYGTSEETSPHWKGAPIPTPHSGEILRRIRVSGIPRDSDCATDWYHFREFRYGYTEMNKTDFSIQPGCICSFVNPDCALEVVTETLSEAEHTILLCSYEFSSVYVSTALQAALDRGVQVVVTVDGQPAGGMKPEEIYCLSRLTTDGAEVFVVNGNVSARSVQHIGALHAKYAVIDDEHSIVMSENFVESGLSIDRLYGNRGWGVVIDDVEFAAYLSHLFWIDARESRCDVSKFVDDCRYNVSANLPAPPTSSHLRGLVRSNRSVSDAVVTVLASPDCSLLEPFLAAYLKSSSTILAEQFQADLSWTQRWSPEEVLSPIAKSLLDGARNGSQMRVLLDSSWFNLERNRAFMTGLNNNMVDGIRLLDNRSPITILHNKGAILDGKLTLVSSNNWCSSSFAENRELAVIINSQEVAEYFTKAFYLDWNSDDIPPVADAGKDVNVLLGDSVTLSGSASADDRIITDWRWDVDSDGFAEGYGAIFRFYPDAPGLYRVKLTVEDLWGNSASDEVVVVVRETRGLGSSGTSRMGMNFLWTFPLGFGAGLFLARAIVMRRVARRPRKVNQPRDAS